MNNQDSTLARPDRMVPHSVEAEEAVIGSVLINSDALYEVAFLQAEDFFIVKNAWVWEAIQRLRQRRENIDYITVVEELKQQKRLEEIGGAAYVTYLLNNTPSSIYAETYARIVERAAIRRRMLSAASEIAQLAHDESGDIDAVVNRAEATLFNATAARSKTTNASLYDITSAYFNEIERLNQQSDVMGIPTGFTDLDGLLGGLQKSDLVIVAGRPGMGKTAWLLNVLLNAAKRKARVQMFSMEMSKPQVMQRLMAAETGIPSDKLRSGKLDDQDWSLFVEATGRLSNLTVHVDDMPHLTPLQLLSTCRRVQNEEGLDLVIVDYLQLMSGGIETENRVQEVGYISRSLKQVARELNVPVLVAAQLNRAVENRQDKRPQLSDLRESGSIEADADVVLFLYRDEVYNENTERVNQADVIVAKHRNGPTGVITLYFRKALTKFENVRRYGVHLVPFSKTYEPADALKNEEAVGD